MSAPSNREETIFERALGMDSPKARDAYLREACGDDEALRERLQGLLAAYDRAGRFLEHNAPDPEAGGSRQREEVDSPFAPECPLPDVGGYKTNVPSSEKPGDRIGRYKLLEQIGEGGMGAVWMAEQEEPVRRRVALKVIKLGMDTRQVLARFEAERQALALMDHPNIARVFDGGATDTARPYFVMELVRGLPITKYCDETKMSTRERLELFGQVCRAVQHAHQKGIIHRDLKPSNLLVTVQDDRPVVKVIDFGIAKATEGRLTDKTLFTGFDQLMGTPAYMSPEQAGLGSLDIDTRSDTYSLGVVLYQLLTGCPPFDTKELLKQGYEALLRTIREVEPVKPSTRLQQERSARPADAAQSTIRNPQSEIEGDLDWIVMKCMEKDRARRYETPNGLAQDLERYLHDEPVQARPPSALYRWQKFARKHRTAVAVAAAFVLLLAAATAVSTALALLANRERSKAVAARNAATAERTRAIHAEGEASEKARQAEAISTFLVETFRRPDPSRDGRDVKVVDLLDQAVQKLEKEFAGTTKTKGDLLDVLGRTFEGLGLYARAVDLHEAALKLRQAEFGPDHRNTLVTMNELAKVYHAAGRLGDALKLHEEALKLAQSRLGDDDRDTLTIMNNLARTLHRLGRLNEAIALFEQTYERRKAVLSDTHFHTLTTLHNLALTYQDAGRAAKALPLHEDAHKLFEDTFGPRHPSTLAAANDLARAYKTVGRMDDAIRLHEATLNMRKDVLGDDHPLTLSTLHNLALTYLDAGRATNALPLHEAALRGFRAKLGARHSDTLAAANDLARAYQAVGRLDEAIRLHEETLAIRREALGEDHRFTLSSMHNLALAYQADHRSNKALPLAEEALRRGKAKLGRGHRYTLAFLSNLATLYEQLGRTNDALAHWRELLEVQREAVPEDRVPRAETMLRIGQILLTQYKVAEAAPLLSESLTIFDEQQPRRTQSFEAQALLGWAMLQAARYSEAEPLLLHAYEGLKRPEARSPLPASVRLLKETVERLVQLYETLGKTAEATRWREKLNAPATVQP